MNNINQKQVFKIITQFTGQSNILTIPRIFIDYMGSLKEALFLSQVLYWTGITQDQEGWFYKAYKDWGDEISLTERQIFPIVKKMKEMGILETKIKKVNGNPVLHYRIEQKNLLQSLFVFLEITKKEKGKLQNVANESNKMSLSNNTEITNIDYIHEKEIYKERKKEENSEISVNNPDNLDNNITDCLKSFTEAIKPIDDSNITKNTEICLKSQNYPINKENKDIEAKELSCYNSQNNVKNGKNCDYNYKNCIKIEKNEKIIEKKRFVKPSVDEIRAYCLERKNNIDPEQFYDFYESKGWKIGKDPMKDWKAAVRTWERNRQISFNVHRKTNALQPKSDAEMQALIDKYKDFC